MANTSVDPFPADALDANRSGHLTTAQRDRLRPIARSTRQNTLIAAVILMVAAAMMVLDDKLSFPLALRMILAVVFVLLALFFFARAVVGGDALTRDLRRGEVRSADGAIGKRSVSQGRRSPRLHWLDVADGAYRVSYAGYTAAPDAGIVRVYFLPRSRRVVNLERLPDAPLTSDLTSRDVLASIGSALLSGNRRELNEFRASMAPLVDAAKAAHDEPVVAPALGVRDPRPLEQAIVGTWRSAIMTLVFDAGGSVTATMFGGMQKRGRWSVDRGGRLVSDVTGEGGAADAWVVGDQLTVSADGTTLTFTRDPAGRSNG